MIMVNQNDTASICTKQWNSHLYDHLKLRFSQLENAADLLTTSLHPDNKVVISGFLLVISIVICSMKQKVKPCLLESQDNYRAYRLY